MKDFLEYCIQLIITYLLVMLFLLAFFAFQDLTIRIYNDNFKPSELASFFLNINHKIAFFSGYFTLFVAVYKLKKTSKWILIKIIFSSLILTGLFFISYSIRFESPSMQRQSEIGKIIPGEDGFSGLLTDRLLFKSAYGGSAIVVSRLTDSAYEETEERFSDQALDSINQKSFFYQRGERYVEDIRVGVENFFQNGILVGLGFLFLIYFTFLGLVFIVSFSKWKLLNAIIISYLSFCYLLALRESFFLNNSLIIQGGILLLLLFIESFLIFKQTKRVYDE